MYQTISNACGTVAMIHAVANNLDVVGLDDGFLKNFVDATKDLSPEERAKKLEGDEVIFDQSDLRAILNFIPGPKG
jgi:ubiquitin carboxyl-terminal hydrolase L3